MWSNDRLKSYKNDNGYQLYMQRHVDNVVMRTLNNDHLYIKCSCTPETRQKEKPYTTWILMDNKASIKSGGCTCVALRGVDKHRNMSVDQFELGNDQTGSNIFYSMAEPTKRGLKSAELSLSAKILKHYLQNPVLLKIYEQLGVFEYIVRGLNGTALMMVAANIVLLCYLPCTNLQIDIKTEGLKSALTQSCKWDRPRQSSNPETIHTLEYGEKNPNRDAYKPLSYNVNRDEIMKSLFKVYKEHGSCLTHTVDPPSDESDIETETINYNILPLEELISKFKSDNETMDQKEFINYICNIHTTEIINLKLLN
ncbi:unnamed protein product [Mytilus coruscus]|uniref:Uncharacterized protein n=1 Tax=Mytilus coruscus TaxID=42192 RepID=A0A6J8A3Q7_MYTCO|nr:unnamed protein product [Mytilus coruscus]